MPQGMSKHRKKIGYKESQRMFSRNAVRTHYKNTKPRPQRGGGRA